MVLLPFLIGAGVYFLSKPGTLCFYSPCGLRVTPRTLEGGVDTWGQCPILNAEEDLALSEVSPFLLVKLSPCEDAWRRNGP